MKFFTRAWHRFELDSEEEERVGVEYRNHLEKIGPRLPDHFREFVQSVSLHDAVVRRIRYTRSECAVAIAMVVGDDQTGYRAVRVRYLNAKIDERELLRLKRGRESSELLSAEVDLEGTEVVHRYLFVGFCELSIRFTRFGYGTKYLKRRVVPERLRVSVR